MASDVVVVGSAWTTVSTDTDLQLDELVFEATSRALRAAGLTRHQIGVSVISSLDLYDGRSISNALLAPAAAGYLNEEFRIEGDAMGAIVFGLSTLAAGQAENAVVVALHVPEIATSDERAIRTLREQISSYTFDAHLDRPVGMAASATLGLHASLAVDSGAVSVDELADRAAADITRGASGRGTRTAATAADVLAAAPVATPLTELMLPASAAGVGALVLSTGVQARRCPQPQARIAGWGLASAPHTSDPLWLTSPAEATAHAGAQAYARAEIDGTDTIEVAEVTDLSPALTDDLLAALRLDTLAPSAVNPSGGVRANHPGIANGMLRTIEAAERCADGATHAVAHSSDDLMGLVSSTAGVLVLEQP
jgi:hypothetical protein